MSWYNPFGTGGAAAGGVPAQGGGGQTGGGQGGGGQGGGGRGRQDDANDRYGGNDDEYVEGDEKISYITDFDDSSLERGVGHIKEIKRLAGKDVNGYLQLMLQQEKNKNAENRLEAERLRGQNLERKNQLAQQNREAESRKRQQDQEAWRDRQQQDQKARAEEAKRRLAEERRMKEEELKHQQRLYEQQLKQNLANEKAIEAERRKTAKLIAEEERKTAIVQEQERSKGKIKGERDNEDVHLRELRLEKELQRETSLAEIESKFKYYSSFAQGFRDTVTDPVKMPLIVGGIAATALGIYGAKYASKFLGKYAEARIGKPSLVRDTSRSSWHDYTSPRALYKRMTSGSQKKDVMDGIILSPAVENKMKFLATATANTKQNKAPFRHVMIHGPPGTGKTLFAKSLAQYSGLDYAIMTGGDLAPLGRNAVTELHKVFDWAEASKDGTIIFIDEADAFLRSGRGDKASMSEDMRNALSAFLYRTGTETDKFMIVMATNVPAVLDKAVFDRIDEVAEFPLPGEEERLKLAELYFEKYITDTVHGTQATIETEGFEEDPKIWERIAKKTEGFSGRQMSKFLIHVQAAMYGGQATSLTPALLEQILNAHVSSRFMDYEDSHL